MPLSAPGRKEHLWFVLTDPDGEQKFLAVNMTEYETFKDQTVILSDGHPFITKKSLIHYPDARLFTISDIDWLISNGMAKNKQPCSAELLKTIREGLLKSDEPAQELQEYLTARWDAR